MKSTINKGFAILVMCVAVLACNDPGGNLPKIDNGANARVVFNYPDNSYLNLLNLAQAAMAFDVYSVNSNIDRIEYTGVYKKFSTGVSSASKLVLTVPAAEFQSGKATRKVLTAPDLATLFAIPGGIAGLSGGDSFTFNQKIFLTDGRTFDATNSAPSITTGGASSFTTLFSVFVGCASDAVKIAGNYTADVDWNDSGEPVGALRDVVITFKGPEPFRYSVTDFTGKLYVPYGGKEYPADFFDICGIPVMLTATSFGTSINYTPTAAEITAGATASKIDLTGAKPIIYFSWFETFNLIKATMKFVKK